MKELPTIYMGADHAGFALKGVLKDFLTEHGYTVIDKGALELDENDDYPDYIPLVASAVAAHPGSRGIIIGGSGQGEAMCANRTKGVRAAVFYGPKSLLSDGGEDDVVWLTREHNNSNILSIGARFVDEEIAKRAVERWLEVGFPGDERHVRRLSKF